MNTFKDLLIGEEYDEVDYDEAQDDALRDAEGRW